MNPKIRMLEQTLRRLIRRRAIVPLVKVITKAHSADLGFLLTRFSEMERNEIIQHCANDEQRSQVIAEAELHIATQVLTSLQPEKAVELLCLMEPDDVSDILENLPEELAGDLLRRMRRSDRTEVEELARYDSATAGGIMSPRFFALNRDITAKEAIEHLQHMGTDLEMVFYVYVVNELEQLLGVVSLRQLVVTKPETRLFDLMTSDVISVTPEVDQEEVAKLASRYGLLAVPVVDDSNKLVGIVTVDDVIDVLREEATEDILRMAGAGDELVGQETVLGSAISRFPWLLVTCVAGAVGVALLSVYADTITRHLPMLYFIPVVLGLAGITGLQSSTIIGQRMIQGRRGYFQLFRQVGAAFLLGLIFGTLLGAADWFFWLRPLENEGFTKAVMLGLGLTGAMTAAAALGGFLPLFFARIRVDPAFGSGPIAAVLADVIGLLLYLSIASSGV
ncbi:MAG: magnesium transporter [Pseudomonadota bacterium]